LPVGSHQSKLKIAKTMARRTDQIVLVQQALEALHAHLWPVVVISFKEVSARSSQPRRVSQISRLLGALVKMDGWERDATSARAPMPVRLLSLRWIPPPYWVDSQAGKVTL
jgi:hypothetical protein